MNLNYDELLQRLFYLDRSLLGKSNDKALDIISEIAPLRFHSYPSGQACCDWAVPKEWILHHAYLKDLCGNLIVSADENILRVVNCSNSFVGKISREELEQYLHVSEELPSSIPYRTSYYNAGWGFCLTREEYNSLSEEEYFVDISSEFVDSRLNIGEATIQGETDREIIFSSYICHPRQAHDGLSGVIMFLKLYNALRHRKNKYTYRFFFGPETIGAISLIHSGVVDPAKVEFCFVGTCVGRLGSMNYKKTFLGVHPIDNIVESMDINCHAFSPTGSDERQYSSPKVRIPTASLMSNPHGQFLEYHTSCDSINSVSMAMIDAMTDKHLEILESYETRTTLLVNHKGGEPFLSKHGLYRQVGVPGHNDWDRLRNWVLFYSDGDHGVIDIAKKSGFSVDKIKNCVNTLIHAGIIEEMVT